MEVTQTIAYVYKWTHLPTMKWYIGSRTAVGCHPDDGYLCSSYHVKPLIESQQDEWKREIISTGTPKEMRFLEEEILELFNAKNDPRSFNRSNKVMGKTITSSYGKVRINKNNKNLFVLKDEAEQYLASGWSLGFSNDIKQTMKINHADVSGTKNPMHGSSRLGEQNPFYGRVHSQETKNTISFKKTGKESKSWLGCYRNNEGVLFESAITAANTCSVSRTTIVNWAKNNKNGWTFIPASEFRKMNLHSPLYSIIQSLMD